MAKVEEFPGVPKRVLKIITPAQEELEFRKRLYPDVSVVEERKIVCTICHKDVKPMFLLKKKSYKHIFLKVAVCKGCCKFYGDGVFSDDEGEDKYCRWCGQGGMLYLCNTCSSSFCKKCVKRNLERDFQKLVEKDNWECFFCDPTPLYKLRALVWAVDKHLEQEKQKMKEREDAKSESAQTVDKPNKRKKSLPNIDVSDMSFNNYAESTKTWLMELQHDLISLGDSLISKVNELKKEVELLSSTVDLNKVTKTLSNIVDTVCSEATIVKSKLIDNVVNLSVEVSRKDDGVSKKFQSRVLEGATHGTTYNVNVDEKKKRKVSQVTDDTCNESENDLFISSPPTGTVCAYSPSKDVGTSNFDKSEIDNDNEIRPSIRLRSLCDLMDPKLSTIEVKKEIPLIENGATKQLKNSETIDISSDDDIIAEKTSVKQTRKLKNELRGNEEISNISSSSDPLSEISISSMEEDKEGKKSSPKKPRTVGGSENTKDKRTSDNTKLLKKKKNIMVNSESTESTDEDCKTLLKKRKALGTSKPSRNKKILSSGSNLKKTIDATSEDSSDEIDKICSFSSLRPKRLRPSSGSSSDDEDDEGANEKSNKQKKAKSDNKPSVMDFFDGEDNSERDEQESDLDSTLKREFSHFPEDISPLTDLPDAILKMSSSTEEDREPPSDSEEVPLAKKRSLKVSDKQLKKKGENDGRIRKDQPKKRCFDKLLNMKIDSDSEEESKKDEESYQKLSLKKTEAEVNESSSSEKESNLAVKKKANPSEKRKLRRKIFSDSEDSFDENDEKTEDEAKSSGDKKSETIGSDSNEEASKNMKGSKRKQSSTESDSSSGKHKKTAKKRKRIKGAKSETSGSEDSSGNMKEKSLNDSASKGRKNIRRVLKEDDLKQTTQAALKAEQERKKRIAEKQQFYNQFLGVEAAEHKELKELVLDFDAKTKEKLLLVDKDLVRKLKPHQAEGIKFMWDSCFETIQMAKKKRGSGCILAHCMGLGKTLQVITLIHTLLNNPEIGIRTVLVVSPVSTVLNWVNEFDKWLKDVGSGEDVTVFHMTKTPANHRTFVLKDWEKTGGVMVMGYNLLRSLLSPKGRIKPSFKKVYQERLLDPGPDLVICDEGHILKNEKTALSVAMAKMKTRRRIVLTGTPLQNNLVEYHCMVQFVKPDLLGTKKEFTNRFVNPIQNGQFEDSTQHDVKVMKRRAHVLHTMLDGIVQRKDYNVLTPYLPPKFEYVIHLKLSDVQVELYRYYLLNMVQQTTDNDTGASVPKGRRLFQDFQILMWICLHPRTLLMKMAKDEKKAELEESDEEGSLKEFIDDSDGSDFKTSSSSSSESDVSGSDSGSEAGVKKKLVARRRKTRGQGSVSEPEEEPAPPVKQWWSDLIGDGDMEDIKKSSKLFLFFTILKYCEEMGDKLLIFSQSLYTLDLIEYFLDLIDSESQKLEEERVAGIKGFEGSWAKGLDYFRLDGSSACENRESWCKSFNRSENTRARLFLISTRAGGLGINLTGANRVIIFDASWNPSFDVQSLFRVYRFGQSKPCYIYRFLSKGTMEEKIYERQVAKLSTSLRVIDEQQIDRHFSHSALAELYMFDPEGSELQGTPSLPKDRLMAELLQNHKDIILSHHQHDSLLENQEDQELTEEERKAAWTEFENEKTQRPPAMNMNINLGTMASVMVEIRTKLKQQNPQWTEEQLRIGVMQILQQYPDYNQMAPYLNILLQTTAAQANQASTMTSYTLNQGPIMPQFPGMTFPNFRYPVYTTNTPQMGVGVGSAAGVKNQNPMLNSLLLNPKHLQNMHNPRAPVQLASPYNGIAGNSKESTGTSTMSEPIVLTDD